MSEEGAVKVWNLLTTTYNFCFGLCKRILIFICLFIFIFIFICLIALNARALPSALTTCLFYLILPYLQEPLNPGAIHSDLPAKHKRFYVKEYKIMLPFSLQ